MHEHLHLSPRLVGKHLPGHCEEPFVLHQYMLKLRIDIEGLGIFRHESWKEANRHALIGCVRVGDMRIIGIIRSHASRIEHVT